MDQAMNTGNKESDNIINETIGDNIRNPMDIYRQQVGIITKQPKTIEDIKKRFNELLYTKAEDVFVIGSNRITDNN